MLVLTVAAENGEELSGWVEAITQAMAAASLAALGDEGDPLEEGQAEPAIEIDQSVIAIMRASVSPAPLEAVENVAATVSAPPEKSEQPLPDGWEKHPSKEYAGRFFYLHTPTNTSQWERPRERSLTQNPDDGAQVWTVQQLGGVESSTTVSLKITDDGVGVWVVGVGEDEAPLLEAEWGEIVAWNVLGEDGLRIELAVTGGAEGASTQSVEFKSDDAPAIGLAMAAGSDEGAEVAI
jgi:hypothetical protein